MALAGLDSFLPDRTMMRTCGWAEFPLNTLTAKEIHNRFLGGLFFKEARQFLKVLVCTMKTGRVVTPYLTWLSSARNKTAKGSEESFSGEI